MDGYAVSTATPCVRHQLPLAHRRSVGQKAITDSAGPRSTMPRPRLLNGLTTYCAKYGANYWYTVTMAKSARATPTVTVPIHRKVGPAPPAWIKPQFAKLVVDPDRAR